MNDHFSFQYPFVPLSSSVCAAIVSCAAVLLSVAWRTSAANIAPFLPVATDPHRARIERQLRDRVLRERARTATDDSESCDGKKTYTSWAVVTGGNGGIGRALAVELARRKSQILSSIRTKSETVYGSTDKIDARGHRLGLILVARDIEKLRIVADEIESCYDVPCTVLPMDLSQPDSSEILHKTTSHHNLPVDILINNAGICITKDLTGTKTSEVEDILSVNVSAVAKLSGHYASDMKDRRMAGMILIVSSVAGACPGLPGAALYGASKAFERSLSAGLRSELTRFGITVSCIMPGATSDTSFSARSGMADGLVWSCPLVPKLLSREVAMSGVRALIRDEAEVVPGWLNWILAKVVTVLFPRRFSMWIGEIFWHPFEMRRMLPRWMLSIGGCHDKFVGSDGAAMDINKRTISSNVEREDKLPTRFLAVIK